MGPFSRDKAPLSASTVARLKEKWQAEWEVWRSRPLDDLEVVYLWVDGVCVKAGLEKEKAVLLVVLAALSDGSKVVVSVTSGYRESTQSWSEVLRDLKQRGMGCPRLVIGDGHLLDLSIQRIERLRLAPSFSRGQRLQSSFCALPSPGLKIRPVKPFSAQ